jgi:hypothetical protein
MQRAIKDKETKRSMTKPNKFSNRLLKRLCHQARPRAHLAKEEADEVLQTNLVGGSEGGRRLDTAKRIAAVLNEVRNTAGESDEDDNDEDDGDFDKEYQEDDDDQESVSSILLAEVFPEANKLPIEHSEDSCMMMPSLTSISQESFFNGSNNMSFGGSSVVSSFGTSSAVGHKSAYWFGAPDLNTITETTEKIGIEDGSSDLESDHRRPGKSSVQLDELQPRWNNSSDHCKKGDQSRWDSSNSSHKKDSTPMIIRRQ